MLWRPLRQWIYSVLGLGYWIVLFGMSIYDVCLLFVLYRVFFFLRGPVFVSTVVSNSPQCSISRPKYRIQGNVTCFRSFIFSHVLHAPPPVLYRFSFDISWFSVEIWAWLPLSMGPVTNHIYRISTQYKPVVSVHFGDGDHSQNGMVG